MKHYITKRRIIKGISIGIILLTAVYLWHQNQHISFADKNMGIVICNTIGEGITPENVRYKDLRKVKKLQLGVVGYYDTLIDIKRCRNIEVLDINSLSLEGDACYEITGKSAGSVKSVEEVKKIQKELEEILPYLRNLKEFSFTNAMKNCEITDIDFLKGCKKLETVWIYYCDISDYSILKNFPRLKEVNLVGSNIKTADDLLEIKKGNHFAIWDTPLAENEKEMERLYKAFPEAKIIN